MEAKTPRQGEESRGTETDEQSVLSNGSGRLVIMICACIAECFLGVFSGPTGSLYTYLTDSQIGRSIAIYSATLSAPL